VVLRDDDLDQVHPVVPGTNAGFLNFPLRLFPSGRGKLYTLWPADLARQRGEAMSDLLANGAAAHSFLSPPEIWFHGPYFR